MHPDTNIIACFLVVVRQKKQNSEVENLVGIRMLITYYFKTADIEATLVVVIQHFRGSCIMCG